MWTNLFIKMKRGFLLGQQPHEKKQQQSHHKKGRPSPSSPPPSAEPLAHKAKEIYPSRLTIEQLIEYEGLKEDLELGRQQVSLTFSRQILLLLKIHGQRLNQSWPKLKQFADRYDSDTQAFAYLSKSDDSRTWYCMGDFFVKMPNEKAQTLVKKGKPTNDIT